jgi:hypothetical protein
MNRPRAKSVSGDQVSKKKRLVYIVAIIVTLAIFVPFESHPWSIYVGAVAGYTVLVFGLRRLSPAPVDAVSRQPSSVARIHFTFPAIVAGWVWLCVVSRPHLPYLLTTEDTSHPYFGLAFIGILGVLLLEYFEQKYLSKIET